MFKKLVLIHILFWIATTALVLYFKVVIHHFSYGLIVTTTIDIGFLAILSYFNIYLIATLYEKRKVVNYWVFMLITVFIVGFFRYQLELALFAQFNIDFQPFGSRVLAAKLLTTLIFIGISFAYYLSVNYLLRKKEAFQVQAQHLQLEIDFHKSRVNPHFLFNTLGNIHALILQKSDRAADVVLELADLMRYMFYDCQENRVKLNKETEFIHSFIKLYRIRSTNELDIVFKKSITTNCSIEPLLFVSFIENAFKHGDIYQGGSMQIEFIEKNNELTFLCTNTYISTKKKDINKQSGFGIENVKKRLKLLYPNTHKLLVSADEKEFKVKLSINLTIENEHNI